MIGEIYVSQSAVDKLRLINKFNPDAPLTLDVYYKPVRPMGHIHLNFTVEKPLTKDEKCDKI